MRELIHVGSIILTVVGACCVVADRGRPRWPELAASALMLVAMTDIAFGAFIAPIYWSVMLLASALMLGALRSPRRARNGPRSFLARSPHMLVHTTLGMIAMACLHVTMSAVDGTTLPADHAHAGVAAGFTPLVLCGSAVYAAMSVLFIRAASSRLEGGQYASMGASVMLMSIGASI